ncbi:UDP-N-acetylmuramoyl-L-alanyl-D-glutamate--2,6-diaminopimelate ligase, partial [bacterium]|nr:UDP-N-acetylmuramoyl-L-alanyl-D-glutamate--2,6-diaminopimelate ligase [bacterium]
MKTDFSKLDKIVKTENLTGISIDSREARAGNLFIAIKGVNFDGHDFVDDAVQKGAKVVVVEKDVYVNQNVKKILVDNSKEVLSYISNIYYKQPFDNIRTVGITGTNGKTSLTYLLESIYNEAGLKNAVIGTVNYRIGSRIIPSTNTSPGAPLIFKLGAEMFSNGIDNCIMEVSSHALAQKRLDLINFDIAVFTNLGRDHLDYHENINDYFQQKLRLFKMLDKNAYAVLNMDDPCYKKIKKIVAANIISYGFGFKSQVRCIERNKDGLIIGYPKGKIDIRNKLPGKYNIYNALAAFSTAYVRGIDVNVIKRGLENCSQIPGRTEKIYWKQRDVNVYIDYAHTPDGLKNVLQALKEKGPKRLISVFGCGGDRDKGKRSKMGFAAWRYSDFCFVTSDNPRNEDPEKIIDQVLKGFLLKNKVERIVDRREAIYKALEISKSGDTVLIAGKGHEAYQIVGNVNLPFNDKDTVEQIIKALDN